MTKKRSLFDFYDLRELEDSGRDSNLKNSFLDSLKGKSLTYKRYAKSPLRYGGGKSLAVGLIVEHFPNDIKRLISPFMGGGSVEIAVANELGLEVMAFDVFDILVNFWQVLCEDSKGLYEELAKLEPKWQYTMGQGETRIGKNRVERGDNDNIKQSHELLIVKE